MEHKRLHLDGSLKRSTLFIIPNLFTSASLFLALFSIVKSSEGEFVTACWLILLAGLCDLLDGPAARLTRSASSFGLHYDSLADMVAFGVAPAFLIFSKLQTIDPELLPTRAPKLALGACALFAICSAIRLARFNTQAGREEKHSFTGLPTPGAAGMVVAAFLVVKDLEVFTQIDEVVNPIWLHRSILGLMVLLSILMVSELRFPKLTSMLHPKEKPFKTFVLIIFVVCVVLMLFDFLPAIIFTAFSSYILFVLGLHGRKQWRRWGAKEPRRTKSQDSIPIKTKS